MSERPGMQAPMRHFPALGVLVLVLVGVAAGSISYYQFAIPHPKSCATPVHRVIFLKAEVQEATGFSITGAALFNQTGAPLPTAANYTSANLNFTDVNFSNYTLTGKTIQAFAGDTITVYMFSANTTNPAQYPPVPPAQGLGHGFGVDGLTIPNPITLTDYETWGGTTFTVSNPTTTVYRCLHLCSNGHGQMTGSLVVSGCA